ncbi:MULTISPECIES: DUF4347 domain-containing protein [Okeania]|uniref:DUF4347 domain-containing protein n=1 Tax=Okeania hirsuta TaxID=1458930 RepID=A0A3N6Q2E5_9CYAN|nr:MULTISPECIES: DUF4347 domain-containing protein [Okeania]NES77390.1 DUF4347 domain-containing protein [Okeania sp. SIO1H4]NES88684.1 DUF4347 domain-containing protein [Okeania sp. SIO2B9]NET21003.1 DUF4347 domain-containing protein [Okeania sp. SIO1H5]NET94219.1 DUF4347 domain-containing protein [Okeania sp. SIO1H2]RQH55355.1 DUF4347 domain-containing protein [Okeania hirsuta]
MNLILKKSTESTKINQKLQQLRQHKRLMVIDTRVENYRQLATGVTPQTKVALIDPNRDGIEQITELLSNYPTNSLYIVCHGDPGILYLGKTPINEQYLAEYSGYLQEWGIVDILLYSCNIASQSNNFIKLLHQLTGANIAASKHQVGNPLKGGTWDLESRIGSVTSEIAFLPQIIQYYPGVFHGLQFYFGQDETGQIRAYLGKDDSVSNGYTNLFSDDYLTLAPVGVWDDRVVEESDTAFDYRYTDNASYFPGFTPQIDMFYDTPVDGSPVDDSFDRERNTYFQVNFLDELKVWDGESFVTTGGEVMTWYQENWLVNDEGEWYVEFVNEVTTGEAVVEGQPYYYAEYDQAGNDHWHYVMELQAGTSPTGIDDGLYLLPVEVETNIPGSIPSDPVYILYNQNLSPAPDADQDTILAAQNYLLENFGMTEPAQEFKAFLDSSQNGVESDATGVATFSLNAEQTEIEYTIQFNGIDLIEDPAERTTDNAVTKIHFHHRDYGTNGSHVLNIFGAPSVDDDDIEIDYESETITGKWDWSDAAANFARHSEPKSDGVYGDWTAPELEIEVVEAYDDGTLGIKLLDGEPRDELNIFEGTQLNFANGATVEITENITISTVEGTTVAASLLEGGDLPTGEIAILPTAQMPGTQPVITSLVNLFHGNLYVQVHTNENPEPGDIRGQILPVRTVEDAEDGVLHGSTSNELFELNAADVGGLEIQEVAGRETLTLEGMETSMSDLHREDTDLIIDVNQDGSFQAADDLTLKDFFAEEAGEVGVGYIELVDEISGSEILTKISSSSNDLLKGTSGNDIKQGKGGNDIIFGFAGDDELYGNRGNDILKGGDGDDILKGGYENDTLKGNSGNDTLIGWLGFDALLGGSGEDSLSGGIGRDRLNGGEDDDILSGGASKDKFIFAANKTFSEANLGVDEITDFVSGKDRILLDVTVFTAIATTPGESLDSSEFAVVDGEADVFTADATIVYDSANSTLYYNPNGIENGLGDGDRFAIFSNGVSLEADDFLVRA